MEREMELGSAPDDKWKEAVNNSPSYSSGHKTGHKLQTTVRFESETLSEIEEFSEVTGCSIAEAVRRLVGQGLDRVRGHSHRGEPVIEALEHLHYEAESQELKEAIDLVEEELIERIDSHA